MASGKQILLDVLRELSQKPVSDSKLSDAAERVRAGMLLHGSTGGDAWEAADELTWSSELDEDGDPIKQGLALKSPNLFLSDLFETLIEPDEVPDNVASKHPELTLDRYRQATRFMWLVLSSVQWFRELSSVEGDGLDVDERERFIDNYIEKLNHFRDHPEDFR